MKPVQRSKTMHPASDLKDEEFPKRCRILFSTLRDWEQGRSQPDTPTWAYVQVIAKNKEMVRLA
jgi:putative transcriptional regulator